jgi:hypothetical protein
MPCLSMILRPDSGPNDVRAGLRFLTVPVQGATPVSGGDMELPLLLAGPILRRVEPGLVSVWLGLSERCDVVLQIWEGRAESGRPNPFGEPHDPNPARRRPAAPGRGDGPAT